MKKYCYLCLLLILPASLVMAEATVFSIKPIKNQLHLLQGKGGNVLASLGTDGLLIVDDDYAENGKLLEDALQVLAGDSPRFVLNTHWHGDHAGSNQYFGERNAIIVAQQNVRKRMAAGQKNSFFNSVVPPSPRSALPLVTYGDSISMHINGNDIELVHYPAGHTGGDSVVYFVQDNVVHMGDHFFNSFFPFVDIASGGNVVSYAANVAEVLTWINDDTIVVPGHGPLASKAELQKFSEMLDGTIDEVRAMLDKNMSLELIQASGLSERWKGWSVGFIPEKIWISFIVQSLQN
jgi:cyclase